MRRLFSSLSFRLALTYAALFVSSILLLLATYYVVAIRIPIDRTKSVVRQEAEILWQVYAHQGQEALVARLEERADAGSDQKAFHALIDPQGRAITTNLPSWPSAFAPRWLQLEADIFADGDEIDFEALVLDHRFADGMRLMVGRDVNNISERERTVRASAAMVIGIASLLGLAGGLLMSRAIGRRIDRFTSTAHVVMAGDMAHRVPLDGSGDEFDHLANTLNAMLDRIEDAMESVRRVSDSIAHELRTPLARLHANLEEASTSAAKRADLIDDAMAEAERLRAIFNAVLRISRIETRTLQASMTGVDLTALLDDAADFYRPEAEAKGIALSTFLQAGLLLRCDRDLLFQALANLLDNAIKYTPAGGEVVLSGRRDGGLVTIAVTDTGPGVPPDALPRLTERFYRHDKAHDGLGLGLSFVAAVARLHQSKLDIRNQTTGLEIRWSLNVPTA